eukprot:6480123-Prymnesium_polylepis.1
MRGEVVRWWDGEMVVVVGWWWRKAEAKAQHPPNTPSLPLARPTWYLSSIPTPHPATCYTTTQLHITQLHNYTTTQPHTAHASAPGTSAASPPAPRPARGGRPAARAPRAAPRSPPAGS